MFNTFVPPESVEEQWDVPALQKALEADWQIQLPLTEMLEKEPNITDEDLRERVVAAARQNYTAKVEQVGTESWSQFERSIMLQAIDTHWREHLSSLDYLRQGIHLRGYAQKNPKQEYKREAFELFSGMLDRIRDDVVRVLMTVRVQSQEQVEQAEAEAAQPHVQNVQYHHPTTTRRWPVPPTTAAPSRCATCCRRSAATIPALRQRQEVQAVPRQAGLSGG